VPAVTLSLGETAGVVAGALLIWGQGDALYLR
jgi:hypothetical protein